MPTCGPLNNYLSTCNLSIAVVFVTNLDFLNLVIWPKREVQRLFLVGNLLSEDILSFPMTTTIFSG